MTTLDHARAEKILTTIRERRALIVGDLMLDEYLFGRVDRISPEAPVPVVRVERESYRLGGAGNVAANARALGATPLLVGVVGDDPPGACFLAELRSRRIDRERVVVASDRPTTQKTRIIAQGQQVVRCDRESRGEILGSLEDSLIAATVAAVADADVVIISDYAKGALTARLLRNLCENAARAGVPVVVDPAVAGYERYQPVTALTPNHHEAAAIAGSAATTDSEIEEAGRAILSRLDAESVLITRGESGMSLLTSGGEASHIPTVAREVFDVSGAGDTVAATFALALAAGANALEAAIVANHAAGIVVAKVGTATAPPDEILATFEPPPH